MAERRRPTTAGERLQRLLVIVPYVVRHPGTTIEELGRMFGVEPSELSRDLGGLFMMGTPPYTSDELIDVIIEDGRVTILMADYFGRPLRLTRAEAIALYLEGSAAAAQLAPDPDAAIRRALTKLATGLGDEAIQRLAASVALDASIPPPVIDALAAAVDQRRRIRFTYFAASTGESSDRLVEPEQVFCDRGNWYVVAWDVDADAERLFRVDRVRDVVDGGAAFRPRGLAGAGRDLYTRGADDVLVRLRLRPGAAWVAEYYAVDDVGTDDDGTMTVTIAAGNLYWVERLLLRLGGDAEVIEPAALTRRVADLAATVAARYR